VAIGQVEATPDVEGTVVDRASPRPRRRRPRQLDGARVVYTRRTTDLAVDGSSAPCRSPVTPRTRTPNAGYPKARRSSTSIAQVTSLPSPWVLGLGPVLRATLAGLAYSSRAAADPGAYPSALEP